MREAYERVQQAVAQRAPRARVEGALVQAQAAPGVELLVGVARDPVFGLVMSLGLGGLWTEVLGDVVHAPLPVGRELVPALLQRLRAWPLLRGARGSAAVDLAALARAVEAVSDAAWALREHIDELEINPLIARGDGAVAVDGLVRLRAAPDVCHVEPPVELAE